jgi:hypothetical protein
MSKGQRGNREAKKPKKVPAPEPVAPTGVMPAPTAADPPRRTRK